MADKLKQEDEGFVDLEDSSGDIILETQTATMTVEKRWKNFDEIRQWERIAREWHD